MPDWTEDYSKPQEPAAYPDHHRAVGLHSQGTCEVGRYNRAAAARCEEPLLSSTPVEESLHWHGTGRNNPHAEAR